MKKIAVYISLLLIGVFFLISITGCGEETKSQTQMVLGNWTQYKNRAYTLLIFHTAGTWDSAVRIADVTSKIVKTKGSAKGTWHIDNNQIIFTVSESDMEMVWETNATIFFDIVELKEGSMKLKADSGRVDTWKQTVAPKAVESDEDVVLILPMGPVVVNLNKNRSNDKDRYLCLNLNMVLKELMPGMEIPPIHPKAREAAIIFLSSLIFNEVKDFDRIKIQVKKLTAILNPYMEDFIKEITIEHVIVATEVDKVDEFIIEHTLVETPSDEEKTEEEEG
jgi:hypothetical protein